MNKTTRSFLPLLVLAVSTSVATELVLPSLDRRYDQCAFLATHNSYANTDEGYASHSANQLRSITKQLDDGVRVINPDIWLVRQKTLSSPTSADCIWFSEEYRDKSTEPRGNLFKNVYKNEPLEVVVAHGDSTHTYAGLLQPCREWKPFRTVLTEIRKWVDTHPNDVITINLENLIHKDNQHFVDQAFKDSGIEKYLFYLDKANPAVPAPEGGPAGGWVVGWYGYPTLRELAKARKNVVLFPRGTESLDADFEVATTYSTKVTMPESLTPATWANKRPESYGPNDFTKWTFAMVHIPFLPNGQDFNKINSITLLRDKLADIKAKWKRLPNHVWVDRYNRGASFPPNAPPGPSLFVNELNEEWESLPNLTAIASISPLPSAYGWNNSNVTVQLSGNGSSIEPITSRSINSKTSKVGQLPSNKSTYNLTGEGVTTICFSAVGALGNRSPLKIVDVSIDRTPPIITGTLDRPPDDGEWYTSSVTAHFECFDALSGIAFCSEDIVLSKEGANQYVVGVAVDQAGNRTTKTITGINIGKKSPVITIDEPRIIWRPLYRKPVPWWFPKPKPVALLVSGTITDSTSGVDRREASFTVSEPSHHFLRRGRILVRKDGSFSFVALLETLRSKKGIDKDAHEYLVTVKAANRAGQFNEGTTTVTVPGNYALD